MILAISKIVSRVTPDNNFRFYILHWKYHVFENTLFSSGNVLYKGVLRVAISEIGVQVETLRSTDILRQNISR